MNGIRYHFYGKEDYQKFAGHDISHSHEENVHHNDLHTSDFHVHRHSYSAELTRTVIFWAQVIILSYFVLTLF